MGLLQRETLRSARIGQPLGIMMADVDHFKQINDSFGHQIGDVVLREVARRMVASVRNYDYVGRYGGEEFLIVLAECAASDLAATAERMRAYVAGKAIETDAGAIPVTLSIGLVASGADFLKGEELLRAADNALYSAKSNGRNRVERASNLSQISQVLAGAAPQ
jgi:two-component system, cell cycle response regulator